MSGPDRRTPAWALVNSDDPLRGRLIAYLVGLERQNHQAARIMATDLRLALDLRDSARLYRVQADNHPADAVRARERAAGVAHGLDDAANHIEERLADLFDLFGDVPAYPPPEQTGGPDEQ